MNEIEKAITYFEALLERLGNGDSDNAVCATALAALREKAGRSKGCEYCTDYEDLASMKRVGCIYIDGNLLVADLYSESMAAEVRYCPMCGKRLEVEHEN